MIGTTQSGFCLAVLLSLCCPTAYAQEQQKPVVSVEWKDSHLHVSASIVLPVKPCVAYGLLTDYANLPDYIPGILEVHVERVSTSAVKIRQVGEVEVLFFHVKMNSSLEMEEVPDQQIVFKQTEGDLESYSGTWDFLETPEGTKLVYDASIVFKGFVPYFLARTVLEREAGKSFVAIAKAVLLRKNKSLSGCSAAQ